ncbi:hypothetical protein R5W24_006478, partial [Gemmata sp. JC717]|uniref:hypothetical protein n=1 Tax=Gemmata algarum TaxID=2975278 RepID=UPI0021BA55DC
RDPKHDLARIMQNAHLEAISRILDRSITAQVLQRLKSATEMRGLIESARIAIEQQLPVEGVLGTYQCVFCRTASYKVICYSRQSGETHNQGYKEGNMGGEYMVFLECPNCGNCQRFKLKYGGERWFPEQAAASNRLG